MISLMRLLFQEDKKFTQSLIEKFFTSQDNSVIHFVIKTLNAVNADELSSSGDPEEKKMFKSTVLRNLQLLMEDVLQYCSQSSLQKL